ncbi:RNA polymerase sigma factor [Dyadobacter sp. CY343]|uniref:RNA polymerase sigma factor n=1 Tax=Dyadobacter sp. CY343 TaxID=2907299 RepID=UPI001F3F9FE7|nr:RNA polymerase subunit sigma-24 [Dyadobacter sp. CY343]MCE7062599.1 RNA polymerase subunit sigma-24 [Dyadobacter sp. CY343]
MDFPNRQILHRITEGDKAAFTQLCGYFHLPAFKLCTVILKDDQEAELVIRNVFDKIWEERSDLETRGNFQSYLFTNLKNQIFVQMKKYQDPAARQQYVDKMQVLSGR